MEPVLSFRMTGTGIWGYRFYQQNNLIGSTTGTVASSSVARIEAPGISWYSPFNVDTIIISGVSRQVKDNQTGDEVYRIVYLQPGYYRMMNMQNGLTVERRNDMYLFGEPGMPVLAMTERIHECSWIPPEANLEPFFKTTVFEEAIPDRLLLAVLSFPALRFY